VKRAGGEDPGGGEGEDEIALRLPDFPHVGHVTDPREKTTEK